MATKDKKASTVRMNLEMSQKVRDKLESLSDNTDLSLSEVIRRSLAVFDLLMNETKKGGKIIIRHGDEEREVLIV